MEDLSLKNKILLLSGFMTLVAATVGLISYSSSRTTAAHFEQVVESDVPSIRALNRMLLSFRLARIELLQLMAPGTTPEMDQASLKIIGEQWAAFDADQKIYLSLLNSEEEKALFEVFRKHTDEAREDFKRAIDLYLKNPAEASNERKEMAKIVLYEIGGPVGLHIREATKKLVDFRANAIDGDTARAEAVAKAGNRLNLLITLFGSMIGFSFAYFFSQRITTKIQSIVSTISESTSSVNTASTQIASASHSLSEAVSEQAASLQETTASLEEISAMISKSSESAVSADQNAQHSQTKANEGQMAVTNMTRSMKEISQSNETIMNQINQSNQQMTEIVKVIQEIAAKTRVINDIVFQTKLLSFNASVEAARAGEHGKGFAVVAEEVGNLAQMSGNAAKEISDILDSSISKVEAIVSETKSKVGALIYDGKNKVEVGVQLAQRCSGVLTEIVENVSKVTVLAQDISHASREQTQGVTEINKAMAQLDTVTQQNSAVSHEAAAAAESLSSQATSLKAAVSELVVAVMGSKIREPQERNRTPTPL